MSISTTIICDRCNLVAMGDTGVFSIDGREEEAYFEIKEPNAKPHAEDKHYCSPACCLAAVDERLTTLWNRRKQTIESIRHFQGSIKKAGE